MPEKYSKLKFRDTDFSSLRNAPYKQPSPLLSLLSFVALCGLAYLLCTAAIAFTRYGRALHVNLVLIIPDGFGPTSHTLARQYNMYSVKNNSSSSPITYTDPLDDILIGNIRTSSADSFISDSAAAATAYSCALKTNNGAIGVSSNSQAQLPCGTVLEAAKLKGFVTGLVSSSQITHPLPASFYAHVPQNENNENNDRISSMLVSEHPIGKQLDFLAAGGLCSFLPSNATAASSCRSDSNNLTLDAQQAGWNVVDSLSSWNDLPVSSAASDTLALLSSNDMDYEIDRDPSTQPSLSQMTSKALNVLSYLARDRTSPGFFLVVGAPRIGDAARSGDPVAHLHEILSYQETIRVAKEYVKNQNDKGWPTILISASTNEAGGITLGKQQQLSNDDSSSLLLDNWNPAVLANATRSSFAISNTIAASSSPNTVSSIASILYANSGISNPTQQELDSLVASQNDVTALQGIISDMVSTRAGINWSTSGYTAADVNLYAYGPEIDDLSGSQENNHIGLFISNILELDRTTVTNRLNSDLLSWGYQQNI